MTRTPMIGPVSPGARSGARPATLRRGDIAAVIADTVRQFTRSDDPRLCALTAARVLAHVTADGTWSSVAGTVTVGPKSSPAAWAARDGDVVLFAPGLAGGMLAATGWLLAADLEALGVILTADAGATEALAGNTTRDTAAGMLADRVVAELGGVQ